MGNCSVCHRFSSPRIKHRRYFLFQGVSRKNIFPQPVRRAIALPYLAFRFLNLNIADRVVCNADWVASQNNFIRRTNTCFP